jgi:acetolactate synthase I/II/III large subunit
VRSGGRALAAAMRLHDVETAFCVPGESYLALLDALLDEPTIRVVGCRHEGGAAMMAEAQGKLLGRPSALLVSRGPGVTNAAIGLHTALQDSTPVLAVVGDVPRGFAGREAFQELDVQTLLRPVCKWSARVESADRIPELAARAFRIATAGRPGPVALIVPEDVLTEATAAADVAPRAASSSAPSARSLAELAELLRAARRPIVVAGGPGWSEDAVRRLGRFAERQALAVVTSFRRQDRIDNESPVHAGNAGIGISPALVERFAEADLVVALGARLGEKTTRGYRLLAAPVPAQTLVHVHPDPQELGRVYHPRLAICCGVGAFLAAAGELPADGAAARAGWVAALRREYEAHREPVAPPAGAALDMGEVMAHLRRVLPPDAILTTDAGSFSTWMQRFYVYRRFPSQLGATNGAMGYGVPAAVAARMTMPERPVVAFAGDGGALMTGNEIATALLHDVDPVVLVLNNDMYGSIRGHQERAYPGRVGPTDLRNPSFADWARSFGAFGELVTRTEQFPDAFARARAAGRVAVLELRLPEAG